MVSSHTDLSPTILNLAGGSFSKLDGWPIPLSEKALASPDSGEHANVEFWGRAVPEGKYGWIEDEPYPGVDNNHKFAARNNTYKALRLHGDGYNLQYTVWCTGEREYYDLNVGVHRSYRLISRLTHLLARSR